MAAGTCYRSFFSERAIIEEFDVPSRFPLTQHVSCTGFALVVLEPCIERIAIGEDAILVGNQFEQVSRSSARCLRHALGFQPLHQSACRLADDVARSTIPENQQNEKGKKSSSVTVMTDDSFYFDGVGRGIGLVLW